jgi:hypothetical protein
MTRFAPILAALVTALAAAAPAQAAESFLGVLADGRTVRFTSQAPTNITPPRAVSGLEAGDRIVALTNGLAVGGSGRLYRFRADLLRATATRVRLPMQGRSFSIVVDPEFTRARFLSDAGVDQVVDVRGETVTPGPGPGLRLESGAPVAPVVTRLPDGRLAGVVPGRAALYVETAPGSGVMAERPVALRDRIAFPPPLAFAVTSETGSAVTGFPESTRHPQSRLLRVDMATGRVTGEAGPYFTRQLVTFASTGAVPDDVTPPRVRVLRFPRTVSLRALRAGRVTLRLRCSEACYALASTAVGGRGNASGGSTRATAGTLTVRLPRHGRRERRLLWLGRDRAFIRLDVHDFVDNRRRIVRRVRVVR